MHLRIILAVMLALSLTQAGNSQAAQAPENASGTPPASQSASSPTAVPPEEMPAGVVPQAKSDDVIVAPPPTPKDVAEAKKLFSSGSKLKASGKLQAALEKFELAAQLDPRSVEYLTAREIARQGFEPTLFDPGRRRKDLTADLDDDTSCVAQDLLLIIQLPHRRLHPVV